MPKLILGYQGYPSKGLTKSQDDNKHAEEFFFIESHLLKISVTFDAIN